MGPQHRGRALDRTQNVRQVPAIAHGNREVQLHLISVIAAHVDMGNVGLRTRERRRHSGQYAFAIVDVDNEAGLKGS